ncbi:MFS transporter [Nocardioides sp.]|uniref:MFS transporter n=1 Tax=Nocardioides sp. TaxID=35761 RepID=UPI002BDADEC0|nr:MFS transporter [Nocardioides sp.]HXH79712.1 MFS transporter [Nocardioides sp.]
MTSGGRVDDLTPDFRRFWWGEAVSSMGSAVTTVALQSLVVFTLAGGTTETGWLNAARWLPYLVIGLVVGALVDRVRRRPVMVVSDLARAGLLLLIPLTWALDVLSFPILFAIMLLFGTASVVNDAASQSIVPRLVAREGLQRAHARLDQAGAAAQTAGPALGGPLVRVVGAPLAFLFDAATYLFSAVMVASMRHTPEPVRSTATPGARQLGREIRDGARWAYGASGLRPLALATHVWFAGQAVVVVLIGPYAFKELGLTETQLGLVLAIAGIGALVGASTSGWVGRRVGTVGAITCSYAVSAAAVVAMLAATWVSIGWAAAAVLAAGQLCHGWSMGLSNSHEMTYRQRATPDALQARTNTTLRSMNRGVVVVVSPLVGVLADRLGYSPILAVGAVLFAVSALVVAFRVPPPAGIA